MKLTNFLILLGGTIATGSDATRELLKIRNDIEGNGVSPGEEEEMADFPPPPPIVRGQSKEFIEENDKQAEKIQGILRTMSSKKKRDMGESEEDQGLGGKEENMDSLEQSDEDTPKPLRDDLPPKRPPPPQFKKQENISDEDEIVPLEEENISPLEKTNNEILSDVDNFHIYGQQNISIIDPFNKITGKTMLKKGKNIVLNIFKYIKIFESIELKLYELKSKTEEIIKSKKPNTLQIGRFLDIISRYMKIKQFESKVLKSFSKGSIVNGLEGFSKLSKKEHTEDFHNELDAKIKEQMLTITITEYKLLKWMKFTNLSISQFDKTDINILGKISQHLHHLQKTYFYIHLLLLRMGQLPGSFSNRNENKENMIPIDLNKISDKKEKSSFLKKINIFSKMRGKKQDKVESFENPNYGLEGTSLKTLDKIIEGNDKKEEENSNETTVLLHDIPTEGKSFLEEDKDKEISLIDNEEDNNDTSIDSLSSEEDNNNNDDDNILSFIEEKDDKKLLFKRNASIYPHSSIYNNTKTNTILKSHFLNTKSLNGTSFLQFWKKKNTNDEENASKKSTKKEEEKEKKKLEEQLKKEEKEKQKEEKKLKELEKKLNKDEKKSSKGKKKITKADISGPTNFQHFIGYGMESVPETKSLVTSLPFSLTVVEIQNIMSINRDSFYNLHYCPEKTIKKRHRNSYSKLRKSFYKIYKSFIDTIEKKAGIPVSDDIKNNLEFFKQQIKLCK